jgi:hypothetical protein
MDYKNESNGLKLCDYVTLDLSETSVLSAGVFEWIIPTGSYYSDRRSQVCTVEIMGGTLKSDTGNDEVIMVSYENGGFNHYTTGNGRPVIGIWSDLDQRVNSTGELLVDARPQLIKLKMKRAGGDATATLLGAITLKFKYYNSIQSSAQLHSEYTPIISL